MLMMMMMMMMRKEINRNDDEDDGAADAWYCNAKWFQVEIFVQALETAPIQLHSKTSGGVSCKASGKTQPKQLWDRNNRPRPAPKQ